MSTSAQKGARVAAKVLLGAIGKSKGVNAVLLATVAFVSEMYPLILIYTEEKGVENIWGSYEHLQHLTCIHSLNWCKWDIINSDYATKTV